VLGVSLDSPVALQRMPSYGVCEGWGCQASGAETPGRQGALHLGRAPQAGSEPAGGAVATAAQRVSGRWRRGRGPGPAGGGAALRPARGAGSGGGRGGGRTGGGAAAGAASGAGWSAVGRAEPAMAARV
jgi:hypothetical protein